MNIQNFSDIDRMLLAQNGRIIHQVWFGTIPNKKTAVKTYEKFKLYRESWKNKNPNWFHIEWTKQLGENVIK